MGSENIQREIEKVLLEQENVFSGRADNNDLKLKFNNECYDLIIKKRG